VVLAPMDGIVIAPDLSELEGRVTRLGESLLLLAESGALSLELEVPEGRVADLEVGARLRFASHARPESPAFTDLVHIESSSVSREGRPIFLARAAMPDGEAWLKPGMEGVAMVEVGTRPNWWFVVHRVTDAARLRFWIE
ncbi:MAG: HlyD family secretion protein, partial [Phycisphaerales bacterium]|nr:HlyD family secretion protein [Phycisphaerales bacterium]